MDRPRIYLSYGMPKSGSTLAFELARTMLEMSGIPQDKLPGDATHPEHPINFVTELNGEAMKKVRAALAPGAGPLVVKTHSRLLPKVEQSLRDGRLIAHAVCRDPRDIALSMLDAAREGRAWGRGPDGLFRTAGDTLERLKTQVRNFERWAACPGVLVLPYEMLAFDTLAAAGLIAGQLGIDADLEKVVHAVTTGRFTQRNRGVSQRWKSEMGKADAEMLGAEFAEFIAARCPAAADSPEALKKPGWLGRLLGG